MKLILTKLPPPKLDDDGELPDLDDEEPSTSAVRGFKKQCRKQSHKPSTSELKPPAPQQQHKQP